MNLKRLAKKKRKQERKAEKRAKAAASGHLLMGRWSSHEHYRNWWMTEKKNEKKQMNQKTRTEPKKVTVQHDELIPVPWTWETHVLDAKNGKKVKIHSNEESTTLYCQGHELFLLRNGATQKLTPMHEIVITDCKNKIFYMKPHEVIKETIKNTIIFREKETAERE